MYLCVYAGEFVHLVQHVLITSVLSASGTLAISSSPSSAVGLPI